VRERSRERERRRRSEREKNVVGVVARFEQERFYGRRERWRRDESVPKEEKSSFVFVRCVFPKRSGDCGGEEERKKEEEQLFFCFFV
jgi:hypothetical protein